MNSWIFDELNRREFIKKTALTGAAAYVGFDYETAAADPFMPCASMNSA
jgi:hypothetical protein